MDKLKTREFKLKDIVWAKAKGNPWWPGIIKKISFYNIQKNNNITKEKIFTIDFIGEKSHVKLTKENIELFLENYKRHLTAKQPSLIRSIKLAKKMCDKKNSRKLINLEENISENIYDIKEQKNKDKELNKINTKKDNKEEIGSEYDSDDEMSYDEYKKNNETKSKKIIDKKNFIPKDEHNKKINEKNEKENDDKNIKINININLTNNNNTFNIFGIQNIEKLANNIDINKNNNNNKGEDSINVINNTINTINEEKDIKKESNFPSLLMPKIFNLNVNNKLEEKNNKEDIQNIEKEIILTNEVISELTKKLTNYQLNLADSINHQIIIDELENFHNILKNSLLKAQNFNQIDFINKDLLSILLTFKLNKNNEIKQKAVNILTILSEYIIKDIFIFTEGEINNLKETKQKIDNNQNINNLFDNEYNNGLELCELINQNSSNICLLSKKIKNKNINNSKSDKNESSNDSDILDDNNINYEINEELYNILFKLKTEKAINEFNNISEHFYKYVYNKNNNGLDLVKSIKRKKICIKMFNLLRKIFPKTDENLIKKIIIYIEYRIRNEDQTLGKKYYKIINNLFNKIKLLYNNI